MTFTKTITRAALLTVIVAASAAPVAAADKYSLHEDRFDSHFGHDPVSSDVPIDKTYFEMTDEQRAVFRARYNGMGPEFEPPFPVDGQLNIFREAKKLQASARVKGKFSALLNVDEKGKAHSIKIVETPDEKINQPMAQILIRNTEYKPAKCSGKPCAMDFVFVMTLDTPGTEAGEHINRHR